MNFKVFFWTAGNGLKSNAVLKLGQIFCALFKFAPMLIEETLAETSFSPVTITRFPLIKREMRNEYVHNKRPCQSIIALHDSSDQNEIAKSKKSNCRAQPFLNFIFLMRPRCDN